MNTVTNDLENGSSMFALGPTERGPSILSVKALMNFIAKVRVVRPRGRHTGIIGQAETM